MRRLTAGMALVLGAAAADGQAYGASFGERDGAVLFSFTARPDVCGDGEHFIRLGRSYIGSFRNGVRDGACVAGPVHVRVTMRTGEIERVESWVGPTRVREGRDLGRMSAKEAARLLIEIAQRAPGNVAAKAILPAVLADSAVVWPQLLTIARDTRTRSKSARQDAALWLSRFAAGAIAGRPNSLLDDDDRLDESDVRTHAVFVASQLPRGEGVPILLETARGRGEWAVRSAALFWLGQTGDPRAVDLFESLLRK